MPSGPAGTPASYLNQGPAEGRIFDLGYQRYEGAREGRPRAVRSLFVGGLRRAWGIGRPFRSKLGPWLLLAIACFPALIAVGIIALGLEDFSPFRYQTYYGFITWLFILFCTIVAPEMVCPDQRSRVLSLYFSRAVGRLDYVFARFVGLFAALMIVALVPQTLLFIGHMFADESPLGYAKDNLDIAARILGAAVVISAYFTSIALAVAAHTVRRIYAAGAFIAPVVMSSAVLAISHEIVKNDVTRYASLLSLQQVPFAATDWIFDTPARGVARTVDLPLELWMIASLGYTAIAIFFLVRRYLTMTP